MSRCITFHIAWFATFAGGCCQSPATPPSLLPATLSVGYNPAELPPKAPAATKARLVELYAISQAPIGTPVSLAAAAIVTGRANPFRGRSTLPIGSRWLASEDANRWLNYRDQLTPSQQTPLAATQAILLPQLITSVAFRTGSTVPDGATQPMPVLQLQEIAGNLRATLSIASATPTTKAPQDASQAEPTATPAKEVIVIADAISPADPFALFIPDPRLLDGGLLLMTRPCATPDEMAVAAALQTAEAKQQSPKQTISVPLPWQLAKQAVGERNRRPALLAVATRLDLDRCIDLILAADEPALIAMTTQLATISAIAANSAKAGWHVEAATWMALIPRMRQDDLPPALRAASRRHIGALANDDATLLVLLKTCEDTDMFTEHLLEENLAALSDRSAAIRVAALNWLKSHKITVDGFDPMASKPERKKSIQQFFKGRGVGR